MLGGLDRRQPALDQPADIDQQAAGNALVQAEALELADLRAHLGQLAAVVFSQAALGPDDLRLHVHGRMAEVEACEPLLGGLLEVLDDALVARVVAEHHHEALVGRNDLAGLVDVEDSPVVGQRMDDDRRILAGLDDLVQVADAPMPHRQRQRAVLPDGLVVLEQEPPDQVGGGQVFVARHRDQRQPELVGHVLDEPRLAAAGRSFEDQRDLRSKGHPEDDLFVILRHVVRSPLDPKLFDGLSRAHESGLSMNLPVALAFTCPAWTIWASTTCNGDWDRQMLRSLTTSGMSRAMGWRKRTCHLGRYRRDAMGEQAVGHRAVGDGRDHAAVEYSAVPLEALFAVKASRHAAVIQHLELQAQSIRDGPAAHYAPGMHVAPSGFQRAADSGVASKVSSLTPGAGTRLTGKFLADESVVDGVGGADVEAAGATEAVGGEHLAGNTVFGCIEWTALTHAPHSMQRARSIFTRKMLTRSRSQLNRPKGQMN